VLLRVPGMWDGRDLGEPATFSLGGRRYMLYNGLRADGRPRAIGLAVLTRRGWRRCGRREQIEPGGSWYRRNAVDPEALVAGDRLYVFFGGGNRPSLGANMGGTIGVRAYRLADVG
jgi:hypothetical protein